MKKLTGRYIITGSRSSNRERRWGERRKVEDAGQHPGCFPTPTETATPETAPLQPPLLLPSAPGSVRAQAGFFSLLVSSIKNHLLPLPGKLKTNEAFKKIA